LTAARNVEIKARLRKPDWQHARAVELADSGPTHLQQEDVFFHSPRGRLKLRFLSDDDGQLIFYERPNQPGPKLSTYDVVSSTEPRRLQEVLAAAYGIRSIVRKSPTVYLVGRTRIHLDEVESLGSFLELEVVLAQNEAPQAGLEVAHELLEQLQIEQADLIAQAYVDLLDGMHPPTASSCP
jgi:predicted adenylyl cyclase CyaB